MTTEDVILNIILATLIGVNLLALLLLLLLSKFPKIIRTLYHMFWKFFYMCEDKLGKKVRPIKVIRGNNRYEKREIKKMNLLESSDHVICPVCEKLVRIELKPGETILEEQLKRLGCVKAIDFDALGKCTCGKEVGVLVQVMAHR